MGMYDNIKFKCKCPVCDNLVNDFQSKDADCELDYLESHQVNNFYTYCSLCGTWIEFDKTDNSKSFTMTIPNLIKTKQIITKEDMVNNLTHDDVSISDYCMSKLMPYKRSTEDV